MKKALIVAVLSLFAANIALADDMSCADKAAQKKLAGAAKNSFMKKCERDTAKAACETQAADKKLHGAAKNSFVKKCEKDATAAK